MDSGGSPRDAAMETDGSIAELAMLDASQLSDDAPPVTAFTSPSKRRASSKVDTAAAENQRLVAKERKQLLDKDFDYKQYVFEDDFSIEKQLAKTLEKA
jgi:hypothetical protein